MINNSAQNDATPNHRGPMMDTETEVKARAFPALYGRRKWLWFVVGWTALGLTQCIRYYVSFGAYLTWPATLVWGISEWYIWGALSPLIIWITNRVGVNPRRWLRCLALHLIGALFVSIVQILLYTVAFYLIRNGFELQMLTTVDNLVDMSAWTLPSRIHSSLLIYSLIAFFGYALNYYARYHAKARRLAQVQAELTHMRLEGLKMQLQPHFLLDTLNAIMELIPTKPEAADLMTARLSELLRNALEDEGIQEVNLQKELALLDRYLEIQQIRFGNRLRVHQDIAPETLDARVPNLFLQPLVENAIQLGMAGDSVEGTVRIRTEHNRESSRLVITIDSPHSTGSISHDGVGDRYLENIHQRLQQLYGDQYRLERQFDSGSGITVRLAIPFRTTPTP